jgi:hypothetical protein
MVIVMESWSAFRSGPSSLPVESGFALSVWSDVPRVTATADSTESLLGSALALTSVHALVPLSARQLD